MNKFNIDPFDGYGFRLSWTKKKANDYQWAKDMADFYDGFFSFRERQDDKRRLKINYDLFNVLISNTNVKIAVACATESAIIFDQLAFSLGSSFSCCGALAATEITDPFSTLG